MDKLLCFALLALRTGKRHGERRAAISLACHCERGEAIPRGGDGYGGGDCFAPLATAGKADGGATLTVAGIFAGEDKTQKFRNG